MSPDGIEMMFEVNLVDQALLLFLLRPQLLPDARIVIVASGIHDPIYHFPASHTTRPPKHSLTQLQGKVPTLVMLG